MRRLRVVAAVCVPPTLYLLYIFHYSVNVPYADDWNLTPDIIAAVHGTLGIPDLWAQYGDTRLFVPKLLFVLFALVDHYNVRHILLFERDNLCR